MESKCSRGGGGRRFAQEGGGGGRPPAGYMVEISFPAMIQIYNAIIWKLGYVVYNLEATFLGM